VLLVLNIRTNTDLKQTVAERDTAYGDLKKKTAELEKSNRELSHAKDEVIEERERLKQVVEFQEGLFDNLDPNSFGARLRVGMRNDLKETLENRGKRRSRYGTSSICRKRRTHRAPLYVVDEPPDAAGSGGQTGRS